jgi:transcriptional regulator with XRE-family HTH domain
MSKATGASRLRAFRKGRGLSVRAVADALGVSHPSVLAWESGSCPSRPYRELIERWSGGEVPSDAWPGTAAERRVAARIATLKADAA